MPLPTYRPGMYKRRAKLTAEQVMQVAINSGASLMSKVPNNRGGQDYSAVVAVATAYAENTGFRPGATNRNSDGSIDTGLWMINSVHRKSHPEWTPQALKDPDTNARAAAALSATFTRMTPDVWFAIKTSRYDRGLRIARAAAERLWAGFDDSRLGVVEDITSVKGVAEFAGDVADDAFSGLAKTLWPVLLSTAVTGTGLALMAYGIVKLFGGGGGTKTAVAHAAPATAAVARKVG